MMRNYTGTILAVPIFIVAYIIDISFYDDNIGISLLVNNKWHYSINFILILLIATLYLSFQDIRKKLIFFVISDFILQNLLFSGIDDLLHSLVEYYISNDFLFLFTMPIATTGMVIWGIIFDSVRNGKRIKDIIKKIIIILIVLPVVLFIFYYSIMLKIVNLFF